MSVVIVLVLVGLAVGAYFVYKSKAVTGSSAVVVSDKPPTNPANPTGSPTNSNVKLD